MLNCYTPFRIALKNITVPDAGKNPEHLEFSYIIAKDNAKWYS